MASNPAPVSTAQMSFQVASGTTVSVTVTALTNGYIYVIPLAEGYSGTFPGSYGGQCNLSNGTLYFTAAQFTAGPNDPSFTFDSGDATNLAVVLQRVGPDEATATMEIAGATLLNPPPASGSFTLTVDAMPGASPAPSLTPKTKTINSGAQPLGLLSDGTVVLAGGATNDQLIFSQWPSGKTWPAPSANAQSLNLTGSGSTTYGIQAAALLQNGSMVAVSADPAGYGSGEIFFAPAASDYEYQFTCLLPSGMGFSSAFPIAVNGNVAVVAEYYPVNYDAGGYDGALTVWQVDGSGTSPVLSNVSPPASLMQPGLFHHHGMVYDPYENLYWLVTGDFAMVRTVLVMDGASGTWYQAVPWGEVPIQATNVIPMPGFVLFISDDYPVGVLRYDRVSGGTLATLQGGGSLTLEVAYSLMDPWGTTTGEDYHEGVPLATVPTVVKTTSGHSQTVTAYFGWQFPWAPGDAAQPLLANIWTTQDGVNFYEVELGLPDYPAGGDATYGVQGVFGPDQNENLVVAVMTNFSSGEFNAVHFSHKDVWGS